MIAGIYNIECDQGSTLTRTFEITYRDEVDPNLYHPWDLTGYTARMQIRPDVYSTTILLEATEEDGYLTIEPEDGKVILYLPAEITATIERSGVYDLEIISSAGEVSKPVRGNFKLNLEVTR